MSFVEFVLQYERDNEANNRRNQEKHAALEVRTLLRRGLLRRGLIQATGLRGGDVRFQPVHWKVLCSLFTVFVLSSMLRQTAFGCSHSS